MPEMQLSPVILELLASRICHDIISPVSAVENGVEFINEIGPDAAKDAMDLIASSAQAATARIQAFRLVYGAGGSDLGIEPKDVHKTLADLMAIENKVTQDWDPHADLGIDPTHKGFCKVIAGMAVLALECLPRGGKISVRPGEAEQTLVYAEGPDILLRPQVEAIINGAGMAAEDLDPRLVHGYVISLFARHYGFQLSIAGKDEKKLTLSLAA